MAPPMTVASEQNATTGDPSILPTAASIPESSSGVISSSVPWSTRAVFRRSAIVVLPGAGSPVIHTVAPVAAMIIVVPFVVIAAIVVPRPGWRIGERQGAGEKGQHHAGDDHSFHGKLPSCGFEPPGQHCAWPLSRT